MQDKFEDLKRHDPEVKELVNYDMEYIYYHDTSLSAPPYYYRCPFPAALELGINGFLANVQKKLEAGRKVSQQAAVLILLHITCSCQESVGFLSNLFFPPLPLQSKAAEAQGGSHMKKQRHMAEVRKQQLV